MLMRIPGSYCKRIVRSPVKKMTLETYASVCSREGDERTRSATAAVDNVELGASKVELSSTVGRGNV